MTIENIQDLIRPELLILIPVLYFIGIGLKNTKKVSDNLIPISLGAVGVVLATIYVIASTPPMNASEFMQMIFAGITQGVLCAGCSVYVNQLIKQNGKDDNA